MAECLPIEELFKRKTKGAPSTLNEGHNKWSPSGSPAKSGSKKRTGGKSSRIAKSPFNNCRTRPSPTKKKTKFVTVKVKPEWNAYLTDDKQYKLSKNQLLDKKKSYTSPRQKASPPSRPSGSIKHIPINLDTSSDALYETREPFNFDDQADVLIGKEIEVMEETLANSLSKHTVHQGKDTIVSPATQKRFSSKSPMKKIVVSSQPQTSPSLESRPMWAVRATSSRNPSFLKPSPMKCSPLSSHSSQVNSPANTFSNTNQKSAQKEGLKSRKSSKVKKSSLSSNEKDDLFDSGDIDFHVDYNIDSILYSDSLDKENIKNNLDFSSSTSNTQEDHQQISQRRATISSQKVAFSKSKSNISDNSNYSGGSSDAYFAVDYSLSSVSSANLPVGSNNATDQSSGDDDFSEFKADDIAGGDRGATGSSSQFLMKEVVELTKKLNEVTSKVDQERKKRREIESKLEKTVHELTETKQALSRVSSPAQSPPDSGSGGSGIVVSGFDDKMTNGQQCKNENEDEDENIPVYKILEQQIKRFNQSQEQGNDDGEDDGCDIEQSNSEKRKAEERRREQDNQIHHMQRDFENRMMFQAEEEITEHKPNQSSSNMQPSWSHLQDFTVESSPAVATRGGDGGNKESHVMTQDILHHQNQASSEKRSQFEKMTGQGDWYEPLPAQNGSRNFVTAVNQYKREEELDIVNTADASIDQRKHNHTTNNSKIINITANSSVGADGVGFQPQTKPQHPLYHPSSQPMASTAFGTRQQPHPVIRIPCVLPESEPATIYQQREAPPLPTATMPSHPLAAVYAMKIPAAQGTSSSNGTYQPRQIPLPSHQYEQGLPQPPESRSRSSRYPPLSDTMTSPIVNMSLSASSNQDASSNTFRGHNFDQANHHHQNPLVSTTSNNHGGKVIGEWSAPSAVKVIPGSLWRMDH